MSTNFKITGLFYQSGGYKLRKYLDIKRAGTTLRKPDLMVVMMNPGSSYPLNGVDHSARPTATQPDATQQQIMKVMDAAAFDYARILNLSDLRTPDSNALYRFVKSPESQALDHSLFSPTRRPELRRLFHRNVPVIFGWGVNPALVPLARQAIECLGVENPLGLMKPASRYAYYHPLPRVYQQQLEWVRQISRQCVR